MSELDHIYNGLVFAGKNNNTNFPSGCDVERMNKNWILTKEDHFYEGDLGEKKYSINDLLVNKIAFGSEAVIMAYNSYDGSFDNNTISIKERFSTSNFTLIVDDKEYIFRACVYQLNEKSIERSIKDFCDEDGVDYKLLTDKQRIEYKNSMRQFYIPTKH